MRGSSRGSSEIFELLIQARTFLWVGEHLWREQLFCGCQIGFGATVVLLQDNVDVGRRDQRFALADTQDGPAACRPVSREVIHELV